MNTPLSLAILSLSALLCITGLSRTVSAQSFPQNVSALEARLGHAEGVRAVKRIQHAYAQYLSAGRWDDAAGLFASDGLLEYGEAQASGRDGVAAFLAERYGDARGELSEGMLNSHLIFSPVVTIGPDGQSAQGRWRLVSLQGRFGEEALWEGGIFENRYVLEDGHWRIAHLKLYPIYGGDYEAGWRILEEETQETVEPVPFHFTADSAGVPWPESLNADDDQDNPARWEVAELDARAARLIDEDRVIRLQHAWGYYRDRQMWDDLADLFHEQGRLAIGPIGTYQGRDSIRRALRQFGNQPLPANRINDHLQLQVVVSVSADGQTATVRGTELQMLGVHGQSSRWGLATFVNRYRKVDGEWQISEVRIHPRMLTSYADGWAEEALPAPEPDDRFPADASSMVMSQPYPALDLPGFPPDRDIGLARREARPDKRETGEATLAELTRKLRVLNAHDGAENVSNAYGYYIDEFLWDNMADVFSIDGWKELSYIGIYDGRERVRQSVVSRYGRGGRRANGMTYHQKTQPVITVAEDGRSARIRTRLFQLNSSTFNPGSFISGIYENRVVNEDGIWKIRSMDLDYAWLANYDGGWQVVEAGSSNRFAPAPGSLQGEQAPDRPLRGKTFAPYPLDLVDMAFHYRNPVSGREPPIFLPGVYEALAESRREND